MRVPLQLFDSSILLHSPTRQIFYVSKLLCRSILLAKLQDAICTAQMWTVIEMGVGILGGSMATLRPLLKHMNLTGFSSGKSNLRRLTGRFDYNSQELGCMKHNNRIGQRTSDIRCGHDWGAMTTTMTAKN